MQESVNWRCKRCIAEGPMSPDTRLRCPRCGLWQRSRCPWRLGGFVAFFLFHGGWMFITYLLYRWCIS